MNGNVERGEERNRTEQNERPNSIAVEQQRLVQSRGYSAAKR